MLNAYPTSPDRPSKSIMTPPRCEILIPVFNGLASVQSCLTSVIDATPPDCAIRVLDDASTDLRLLDWLAELARAHPQVTVTYARENLGFAGNVNRGLSTATSDVILLNSDTLVTPGWVERLLDCAASDPRIALVCPLSNHATILSVPVMNRENRLPDGLSVARFAALVADCAQRDYPRLPVAVGFCMLIRLEPLRRLGGLHTAYRQGYGEECDYSLRAWEAGYQVVCCDDAFVYHAGERSFGARAGMEEVKRRNAALLLARWPMYDRLIAHFCRLNPLREVQERILTGIAQARGDRAPHLLHVLHSYQTLGGTELHSQWIAEGLAESFRTTLLFPADAGDEALDFQCVEDREWWRVLAYRRTERADAPRLFGHVASLRDAAVEASFARLVSGGAVSLVHFQHLLDWGTLALPGIAKRLGAAVVLSLHDYYLFCPVFDLLRPDGARCDKPCADPDHPDCRHCLSQTAAGMSEASLRDYLTARRALLLEAFDCADTLIDRKSVV